MTIEEVTKAIVTIMGALSIIATTLSVFFPKGSRMGYILAKVGSDIKGHTSPTMLEESTDAQSRNHQED